MICSVINVSHYVTLRKTRHPMIPEAFILKKKCLYNNYSYYARHPYDIFIAF